MNARKSGRTVMANDADARTRLALAEEYLLLAEMAGDSADAPARTAGVGNAVLAGIAFGDVLCIRALGEYSSSGNHGDAVDLLGTVDREAAKHLQTLVGMKTASQYGATVVSTTNATRAMRAAQTLAERARQG